MKPQVVTDKDFKTVVLNNKGFSVVDFNAVWCGPCKRMSPSIDALTADKEIKVFKLDIDDSPKTTEFYDVKRIPCIVFIRDGKEIDRLTGLCGLVELKNWVNQTKREK